MADPLGIGVVPWAVGKSLDLLLEKLYTEYQHIRNCEKECNAFTQQLESLSGFAKEIEAKLKQHPPNSDFLSKWWDDVRKCLEESLELPKSFQPAQIWDFRSYKHKSRLRKHILAKRDELENLIGSRSTVARFMFEINANVDEMKGEITAKLDGVKLQITANADEMKEEMTRMKDHLIEITKEQVKHGGNPQTIAAHLGTMQSFGRNDEVSKQFDDCAITSYASFDEPIFGRKEIIQELESCLLDLKGPKIIALHGTGGAGKTHIVQALLQEPKVKSCFEKKIFLVPVGRELQTLDLQKKVDEQIFSANESEGEGLIVLDDVWSKKVIKFIEASKYNKFRFIITTRQLSEVEGCENFHRVHVKVLPETESWELFCYHAFRFGKRIPLALNDVAKNIARECKGLPLALKVIGTAMSNKTIVKEWDNALRRLRRQEMIDVDQENELIQVLKLSYDFLESMEISVGNNKIRECFLCFGAFKEDEEISIYDLMNCWVGEGLLNDDDTPLNQTYLILGVLIGSSLIENVLSTGLPRCKIHDELRDLIFYISKKERQYEDLFEVAASASRPLNQTDYDKVLRISWRYMQLLSPIQAPNLKVLLLDNSSISSELLINSIPNLCSLQVLSLKDTRLLDPEVVVLDLEKLQRLVVLDLSGCSWIEAIPCSLGKLRELQVLNLYGCDNLRKLPNDVFLGLKSLKILRLAVTFHYEVEEEKGMFLRRLSDGGVNQFKNLIGLTWFTFSSSIKQLPTNIENMTELTILHMNCPVTDLEPLKRLNKLEDLRVYNSRLSKLPDWIGEISSLIILRIGTDDGEAQYLPGLDALCRLGILELAGWASLVSLPRSPGCVDRFLCLEELHIHDCQSLEWREEGFGSLRILEIKKCHKMSFQYFGCFPKLEQLQIWEFDEMLPEAHAFPQLEYVFLYGVRRGGKAQIPKSWVTPGSLCNLESLKTFSVKWPELIGEGALPSLRKLDVEDVEAFPKITVLPSLRELELRAVEVFPKITETALPALRTFTWKTELIPDSFWRFLDGLPHLETLHVTLDCYTSLKEWGSIHVPKILRLHCLGGERLPESMGRKGSPFESLEDLNLGFFGELEELPEVEASALPNLKRLYISNCPKLERIPEFYIKFLDEDCKKRGWKY